MTEIVLHGEVDSISVPGPFNERYVRIKSDEDKLYLTTLQNKWKINNLQKHITGMFKLQFVYAGDEFYYKSGNRGVIKNDNIYLIDFMPDES